MSTTTVSSASLAVANSEPQRSIADLLAPLDQLAAKSSSLIAKPERNRVELSAAALAVKRSHAR